VHPPWVRPWSQVRIRLRILPSSSKNSQKTFISAVL
jgi:hypothetical protein